MNRDMLCRALSSFTEDDHQQEDKEGNMINRVIKAIRQNIVAWLALFVALSGTSMAASHYIITSTKQIKPSVLRQLRGAKGARGAPGAMGAAGAKGATGAQGPAGASGAMGSAGAKGEKGTTGMVGKEGPEGLEGKEGPEGKEGTSGTALAYAHVEKEGKIAAGESKNFQDATVKMPEPGVYCISGISGLGSGAHNVVATIDANEPTASFVSATVGVGKFCPPGTEVSVETYEPLLEEENGKVIGIEAETIEHAFYVVLD
jgi:Collagen triple helix repeat (20 copies)